MVGAEVRLLNDLGCRLILIPVQPLQRLRILGEATPSLLMLSVVVRWGLSLSLPSFNRGILSLGSHLCVNGLTFILLSLKWSALVHH